MSELDRQKWNTRYQSGSHASTAPSAFLVSLADRLPAEARALDVAGGVGRNALWLAARGMDVTLVDISGVALAIAAERAAALERPLRTLERDLAEDGLPPGPWDLIVSVLYLERPLLAQVASVLAPGGLFVMLQPTVTNLERHPRPPRAFLLEPGELRTLIGGLDMLELDESWSEDGYHEARLLARRPG